MVSFAAELLFPGSNAIWSALFAPLLGSQFPLTPTRSLREGARCGLQEHIASLCFHPATLTHRMKLNPTRPMILSLPEGPRSAKRSPNLGHPSRGGLGKPLGWGEGEFGAFKFLKAIGLKAELQTKSRFAPLRFAIRKADWKGCAAPAGGSPRSGLAARCEKRHASDYSRNRKTVKRTPRSGASSV